MLLVRYEHKGETQAGYLDGDSVGSLTGDVFGDFMRGGPVADVRQVRLLAPCQPGKVVAVAHNFADQLRELNLPAPDLPELFFKAPTAVIGPGQPIVLPPQAERVQPGAELAVVIGRAGRWITPETAPQHILGYTCANNVLALDLAMQDQAWTRAGSFDTFLPLGPAIATHVDPAELMLTCAVNGVTRQLSSTHDLLFDVPQVVAYVSSVMTLLPGDVILMGTPAGGGEGLAPGDEVEISIEHIGSLRNPVVTDTRTS